MGVLARVLAIAAGLALVPAAAQANVGIPTIIVVMPIMVVSLIPVIVLEAYIYRRRLGVSGGRSGKVATVSNLVSTFLGIPIAWALMVVMQGVSGAGRPYDLGTFQGKVLSFTLQAPWLIPHDNANWLLPAAGLVLMVPFFFASWWSEYLVARRMLRDHERPAVWLATRNANLASYALLALWPFTGLAVTL